MLIKSIELGNIRSYVNEEISFPHGSVLLSGDIGSGKSTILLAIDFALFGICKGEVEGSDLLRHGKDKGFVELNLDVDGKDVKIKRTLKRGKGITQEPGMIIIDGIAQELMPSEMNAKVHELLGYTKEASRRNIPIFRYTVYTPQEEMKSILISKDRIEVLRKIFGIDKYGIIRNNARLLLTELRSLKKISEAKFADLESKLSELDKLKSDIDRIDNDLENERLMLRGIKEKLEIKKSEIKDLEKDIENCQRLEKNKAALESQMSMFDNKLSAAIADISEIEEKIDRYSEDLKNLQVSGEPEKLKNEVMDIRKKKLEFMSKTGSIKNEIEKLQEIFDRGVCGFCGQPVHNKHEFRKGIDDRIEELRNIEVMLLELGENEENISKDLSKIENMKHVRNSLNEFYLIHKKLLKGREESEKLISEIKIALEKLNNGLAGFEGKKLLYRESQKIIEGMRNEMMTFEKSVSKLEAEKNSSESMLKLLEKDIEMKIKEKERAQHISELITWVDEHFINLMENIEKHVMHSIHKEFEKFFQEWFSMLMGEQLDVRIDEQFTPIIEQNGYETEYANLSGGEKTSTALAYRLALNKVVNILIDGIKTKDMLILDEPTDGFSTDQLERMRDVLDALGLGQIIIVSHEPKIDTFVENTIKIYKDGHVSRIVK